MEYTKDMIFSVSYNEENDSIKLKGGRWTSSFLDAIKKHRIMTATVLSGIVFIIADVILLSNFFRILTMI